MKKHGSAKTDWCGENVLTVIVWSKFARACPHEMGCGTRRVRRVTGSSSRSCCRLSRYINSGRSSLRSDWFAERHQVESAPLHLRPVAPEAQTPPTHDFLRGARLCECVRVWHGSLGLDSLLIFCLVTTLRAHMSASVRLARVCALRLWPLSKAHTRASVWSPSQF